MARKHYEKDPHWVAPLDSEVHAVLGPSNPFFKHAQGQLWLAIRGDRVVGRIAGLVDSFHNNIHGEQTAFFGFFESVDCIETARALFDTVSQWARSLGMTRLRGPMNPSINDECGLLVEGFHSPPVLMMTYNPPWYPKLLEESGFYRVKDLLAFDISVAEAPEARLRRLREGVVRRHPDLSLRPVTRQSLATDVPGIKQVYNSAWEKNWGAVPLTESEIDFMIQRLQPLLVEGLVWLAEHQGTAVGFLLALPDFNEALKPLRGKLFSAGVWKAIPYLAGWKKPAAIRLVALGVCEEFRGRGVEAAMLTETLWTCQRKGFTTCEASWILENNLPVQRVIEIFGGRRYKTYRVYDRDMEAR